MLFPVSGIESLNKKMSTKKGDTKKTERINESALVVIALKCVSWVNENHSIKI